MAGLFDYYGQPQGMGDTLGGLLARLAPFAQQQTAPTTQLPSTADQPTSYQKIGNQQFPVFGSPDPAQLPQNAAPAQGQLPQGATVPGATAQPGLADSLSGALGGFSNGIQTGLLSAIRGGIEGARTGMTPQNQTVQALVSRGLDPAIAQQVARDPGLLRSVLPSLIGGGQTDDIKEYQFAKREDPSLTFDKFMSRKKSVTGEYGLTPIWGTDAQGNPTFIQPGKSGDARQATLPEGFKIARDPIKLDAGTHWVILDPQTRQPVGTIPKDLKGAEVAKAVGKEEGEAVAAYENMTSKMPGLTSVIKKLDDLSTKATYTIAGQTIDWASRQAGMQPRDAAVARAEYISIVDNQILPLLRDTFGAAFTQKEGDTLRDTLGDANASPQEKQAKLRAFIEQKQRDIEALAVRTGKVTPKSVTTAPSAAGGSSIDDLVKKYSR